MSNSPFLELVPPPQPQNFTGGRVSVSLALVGWLVRWTSSAPESFTCLLRSRDDDERERLGFDIPYCLTDRLVVGGRTVQHKEVFDQRKGQALGSRSQGGTETAGTKSGFSRKTPLSPTQYAYPCRALASCHLDSRKIDARLPIIARISVFSL